MLLNKAMEILNDGRLQVAHSRRPHKLVVEVFEPGRIGGTPCSVVSSIDIGFDWNSGSVMIHTTEPLTRLSAEDVAAIRESVSKGQSWHAYQQYKEQDAKTKLVEAEVLKLKALLLEAQTNLTGMAAAIKGLDEYDDLEGELETVSDLVDRIEDTLNPEEADPDEQ